MMRLSSIFRLASVALVILIFHPYRFAELQMYLKTIDESEIIDNLEQNADTMSSPNESLCDIDMDILRQWTLNRTTKQSHTLPGGQWSPPHCSARYDSKFTRII